MPGCSVAGYQVSSVIDETVFVVVAFCVQTPIGSYLKARYSQPTR